tara:strand:+ start:329 stop:532 length:204 start_codon:yes stop_codon:yes gene_type:complete
MNTPGEIADSSDTVEALNSEAISSDQETSMSAAERYIAERREETDRELAENMSKFQSALDQIGAMEL